MRRPLSQTFEGGTSAISDAIEKTTNFSRKGAFSIKNSTSSSAPAGYCQNIPASNRVARPFADKRGTFEWTRS